MSNQFVNPDGSSWTPAQIQKYYAQWAQYSTNPQYQQYMKQYQQFQPATQPISYDVNSSQKTYAQAVTEPTKPITKPVKPKRKAETRSVTEQSLNRSFAPKQAVAAPKSKTAAEAAIWPSNLKSYVSRVFDNCPAATRKSVELKLKDVIQFAQNDNTIWSTDWDTFPLPEGSEPVPTPIKLGTAFIAAGSKKSKKKKQKQSLLNMIPPDVLPRTNLIDTDSDLTHLPPSQKRAELTLREQRKSRFDSDMHTIQAKMIKKQISIPKKNKNYYSNPDSIDWNERPIMGTCAELEKSYLRLTSAPDPATVRPLIILRKTLEMLKKKWKAEQNYTYICDQLKSLRQDLTVQRIKNEFTVKVYETHSRIAIEKGDLGEFNQCSAQLRQLYTFSNLRGCEDEFTAYRILYMIHTLNRHDLIELIGSIANPGVSVQHAFQVRSSLSNGNYHSFFQLYHDAPNMGAYLMDHFILRERLKTFLQLARAYRPTLSISHIAKTLGYVPLDEEVRRPIERQVLGWVKELQIGLVDGMVDCKAAVPILVKLIEEHKGVDIKGQIH